MPPDMAPYFLSLRAVTQHNLHFFIDNAEAFSEFFDQLAPVHPLGQSKETLP